MLNLSERLSQELFSRGASAVAFADLKGVPANARQYKDSGISIAVSLEPSVIAPLTRGPTEAYYAEYKEINLRLTELGQYGAAFLQGEGYEAILLAPTIHDNDKRTLSSPLPHKTVATTAGLGWIGKSALLVTKKFGSALRLISVLTNAPLDYGDGIEKSFCGTCSECVKACPAAALTGQHWATNRVRDDLFKVNSCHKRLLENKNKAGITALICGICIAVCPWSQKYIKNHLSGSKNG